MALHGLLQGYLYVYATFILDACITVYTVPHKCPAVVWLPLRLWRLHAHLHEPRLFRVHVELIFVLPHGVPCVCFDARIDIVSVYRNAAQWLAGGSVCTRSLPTAHASSQVAVLVKTFVLRVYRVPGYCAPNGPRACSRWVRNNSARTKRKLNSVVCVRNTTISTEQSPLVGEVSPKFWG
jgi:hypothetical protein